LAYSFPNRYWLSPKNHADLVASIRWAAHDRLSAEIIGPDWLTIELAQQENNLWLLHLVNYKPKATMDGVQAILRPPSNLHIKEAIFVTPERVTGETLRMTPRRDGVALEIPSMSVYGLVLMTLGQT
jgi:hypothetical protein